MNQFSLDLKPNRAVLFAGVIFVISIFSPFCPLRAQDSGPVAKDSINLRANIIPKGDIKETTAPITGNDLVQADFPGSWPMFGSELRMKIGGYIKADGLYDFDGTTDRTQFLMSTIPVEGQEEFGNDGYVNFFARESRFNIEVRRVGEGKLPLKMFLEGDFWSEGNQLRLRHAYMTVGDFIIGQTWTTLSFLESLPNLIDFAAGDALFGGRAVQVRYQKSLSPHLKLALGIEQLQYLGIGNPSDLQGEASAQLPLFAARLDYRWETGLLQVGSSIGQLRWDGGAGNPNPTAIQIAAVVGGRQYLGKMNYFTWNVSVGQGSGENIMAFIGSDANAVLTEDYELETMPSTAVVLGFVHKWSETLASNLSYAYGWLDTPETRDPFSLKDGGVGHVNLIYSPLKYLSGGIEYMWGAQRTSNNAYGSASRIQVMTKFSF